MNQRLAVLRSVTIVSIATYIEYAIGFVVSIWIARGLGPDDFGRYAFTIWLCGWLIVCSNHALTTSSTKFIAEAGGAGSPDVASHIAHRLNQWQHISSFIVIALFVLATLFVKPDQWHDLMLPVTALIIIAVVSKANYAMWVAIEKGQERFEPEAIAAVLASVVALGLVIAASLAHGRLVDFIAIYAVSSLLLNLINRIAFRRCCQPFTAGPIPVAIRQRLGTHLKLTGVLVLLGSLGGTSVEMFLLNAFASPTAVGFFAIAIMLTRGAVQLFSVGLTSTLLPYMAKSFGQHGHAHATRFLSEATRFYWAMGLAIAGLGFIATPDIIQLMYGDRYVGAIPVVQTILVLAGLLLVGNGIAGFQTVVDRQGDRIRVTAGALMVNVILGLALIPPFGLPGAVVSFAGGHITGLSLSIHYLRKATSGGIPVASMSRLLVVGILATAMAWLVVAALPGLYGFIPAGLVFVSIYVFASIKVNYWTENDFELMDVVAGRFGALGRGAMRVLHGLRNAGSRS